MGLGKDKDEILTQDSISLKATLTLTVMALPSLPHPGAFLGPCCVLRASKEAARSMETLLLWYWLLVLIPTHCDGAQRVFTMASDHLGSDLGSAAVIRCHLAVDCVVRGKHKLGVTWA